MTGYFWLLSESEQVSSDRLFRVRSTQPFNAADVPVSIVGSGVHGEPYYASTLKVGDFCVMALPSEENWVIGRILLFAFKNKTGKFGQQCSKKCINTGVPVDAIGIMCVWYSESTCTHEQKRTYVPKTKWGAIHEFRSLSYYVCSLSQECLHSVQTSTSTSGEEYKGIIKRSTSDDSPFSVASFVLTDETLLKIDELVGKKKFKVTSESNEVIDLTCTSTKLAEQQKNASGGTSGGKRKLWVKVQGSSYNFRRQENLGK